MITILFSNSSNSVNNDNNNNNAIVSSLLLQLSVMIACVCVSMSGRACVNSSNRVSHEVIHEKQVACRL